MSIKLTQEIFKDKIVEVYGKFTISGNAIKPQIDPDIWFWPEEIDEHILEPEKMLRLHLIEVKIPWGGIYQNESGC
jgi:hypothetical protein